MKFNTLAKQLGHSVLELAEKVKDIIPGANGGTDVDEQQEQKIRARIASNRKERSPQPTANGNSANAAFETEALRDTELGIAALDGMLTEYSYRLQGLGVAHQWIKSCNQSPL